MVFERPLWSSKEQRSTTEERTTATRKEAEESTTATREKEGESTTDTRKKALLPSWSGCHPTGNNTEGETNNVDGD